MAFFIDLTQFYFRIQSIFSKYPVKTYPQRKIKIRGTAFEQLDSYLFLPLNYPGEDFLCGKVTSGGYENTNT
jgi:hypothetical protein